MRPTPGGMRNTETTMRHSAILPATLLSLLAAEGATAGAFALREGSAAAMGAALAGRTSGDGNVSFILSNPAALRGVERGEVSNGLAILLNDTKARMDSATAPFSPRDEPGTTGLVPSLAVGWRLSPEWIIGLGIDSPFGLASEYSSNFAGSFDGTRSELLTLAVTPMLAWQVTPQVTLGAGVSVIYADAELANRVSATETSAIKGDGFSFGFTLGALVEPLPGTVFGARFRSGSRQTLSGRFDPNYQVPPGVGLLTLSGKGEAEYRLPASVNIGVTQRVTPSLRIMAEVEFTDWSVYDRIDITETATGITISDPQNYRDSRLYAFGVEYDYSDRLTLRAGIAYDETPVQGQFRTTRVPDTDKLWLAGGVSYALTDRLSIDAAYVLLQGVGSPDATLRFGPDAGQRVRFDTTIHEVAVNVNWRF